VLLLDDLRQLDERLLPRDGKFNLLVSNHRTRYPAAAAAAPVDLHLALWNPFQVLDIAAPAVVTWGYAEGALAALRDWLGGLTAAPGRSPVSLSPRPATAS
jgi:beta-N-acetylhexosaminidase